LVVDDRNFRMQRARFTVGISTCSQSTGLQRMLNHCCHAPGASASRSAAQILDRPHLRLGQLTDLMCRSGHLPSHFIPRWIAYFSAAHLSLNCLFRAARPDFVALSIRKRSSHVAASRIARSHLHFQMNPTRLLTWRAHKSGFGARSVRYALRVHSPR